MSKLLVATLAFCLLLTLLLGAFSDIGISGIPKQPLVNLPFINEDNRGYAGVSSRCERITTHCVVEGVGKRKFVSDAHEKQRTKNLASLNVSRFVNIGLGQQQSVMRMFRFSGQEKPTILKRLALFIITGYPKIPERLLNVYALVEIVKKVSCCKDVRCWHFPNIFNGNVGIDARTRFFVSECASNTYAQFQPGSLFGNKPLAVQSIGLIRGSNTLGGVNKRGEQNGNPESARVKLPPRNDHQIRSCVSHRFLGLKIGFFTLLGFLAEGIAVWFAARLVFNGRGWRHRIGAGGLAFGGGLSCLAIWGWGLYCDPLALYYGGLNFLSLLLGT